MSSHATSSKSNTDPQIAPPYYLNMKLDLQTIAWDHTHEIEAHNHTRSKLNQYVTKVLQYEMALGQEREITSTLQSGIRALQGQIQLATRARTIAEERLEVLNGIIRRSHTSPGPHTKVDYTRGEYTPPAMTTDDLPDYISVVDDVEIREHKRPRTAKRTRQNEVGQDILHTGGSGSESHKHQIKGE